MIITTGTGAHQCNTAEQHQSQVHLLDISGNTILIIHDLQDIRAIEGGRIAVKAPPLPSLEERVALVEQAISDIPSKIKAAIQNMGMLL